MTSVFVASSVPTGSGKPEGHDRKLRLRNSLHRNGRWGRRRPIVDDGESERGDEHQQRKRDEGRRHVRKRERTGDREVAPEVWRAVRWRAGVEGEYAEWRGVRVGVFPVGFAREQANETVRAPPHEHTGLIARIGPWQRRVCPFAQPASSVIAEDHAATGFAAADEQIVVAVAIHICPADSRSERAEFARQERLTREIVEGRIQVDMFEPGADVFEERGCGRILPLGFGVWSLEFGVWNFL